MSFFGVELNAQVSKLVYGFRLQLSRFKHGPNVRTIYRSLAQYDPECTGLVSSLHFEKSLNANGLFFKQYELQVWEKAYGQEGKINWFNFLAHLRQPMGPVRRALVEQIFDSIDQEKKGRVEVERLMSSYNAKANEACISKRRSEQQVKEDIVQLVVVTDGAVEKAEFVAFYDDLSINIPVNDTFLRYVSEQWNYTYKHPGAVKEEDIIRASRTLRNRLLERSRGTNDIVEIRKLFQHFDENHNSNFGAYDIDRMIAKLNLRVEPEVVEAIFQRMDQNQSGFVELEDFKFFLVNDPYPF